jgi:aryl-alcohol dehydrogenase-like predicted oxidoreductase
MPPFGPNDAGLSKKHIAESCNNSLKRLGMDYLDLYMCHRPDPSTPLEETVMAMEDLIRAGKILYWGVSEWPAEMMVEANAIARSLGTRQIAVNEPRYSLLYRYPERSVFPTTLKEGIGNVIFSGLAHGMLTGKYKPGQQWSATDVRATRPAAELERDIREAQRLAVEEVPSGVPMAQWALAWCLKNPVVSAVIPGCKSVAQLRANAAAGDLVIA